MLELCLARRGGTTTPHYHSTIRNPIPDGSAREGTLARRLRQLLAHLTVIHLDRHQGADINYVLGDLLT